MQWASVLACSASQGRVGAFSPSKLNNLSIPIFSSDLGMSLLTYTLHAELLLNWGRDPPPDHCSEEARDLHALYQRQRSLAACRLKQGFASPMLLSIEWNIRQDILMLFTTLGRGPQPMKLYYMRYPSGVWQRHSLITNVSDSLDACFDQAIWGADDTSIILLSSCATLIWCTRSDALISRHRFNVVEFSLWAPEQPLRVKCNPNGRILALLGMWSLVLYSLATQKILHVKEYPQAKLPLGLGWSAAGDKLMLARGREWHILLFGRVRRFSQEGRQMAELLELLSPRAGFPPSRQHGNGVCESGCCMLPGLAAVSVPFAVGNNIEHFMDHQQTPGCCPGWVDDSFPVHPNW